MQTPPQLKKILASNPALQLNMELGSSTNGIWSSIVFQETAQTAEQPEPHIPKFVQQTPFPVTVSMVIVAF